MKLQSLFLLSLLLLSSLYAQDVTLTMEQYKELKANSMKQGQIINELEIKLTEQQKRDNELIESLKKDLEKQQELMNETEQSLTKSKNQTIFDKAISFFIGVLAGSVAINIVYLLNT